MAAVCKKIIGVGPAPGVEWYRVFGTKTNAKFVKNTIEVYHPCMWTPDSIREILAAFELSGAAVSSIVSDISGVLNEKAAERSKLSVYSCCMCTHLTRVLVYCNLRSKWYFRAWFGTAVQSATCLTELLCCDVHASQAAMHCSLQVPACTPDQRSKCLLMVAKVLQSLVWHCRTVSNLFDVAVVL
jgi:hypothetical protein